MNSLMQSPSRSTDPLSRAEIFWHKIVQTFKYSVKEFCREMPNLSRRNWKRLKKLCKFLKGVPKIV